MECLWWTPGGAGEEKATKLISFSRNDDKVTDECSDVWGEKESCVSSSLLEPPNPSQQHLQTYCVRDIAKKKNAVHPKLLLN